MYSSKDTENQSLAEQESKNFNMAISFPVRFWIFLISLIPSFVCYVFVLWHLLCDRVLRGTLSNHTIILLLIINLIYELINIPLYLSYFYHFGNVFPSTPNVCLFWIFIDEGLFSISLLIFVWATVERYIIIFHKKSISTWKGRALFHYSPLIILFIYLFLFFSFTVIFPPCKNTFEYDAPICGFPVGYYDVKLVGIWDVLFHDISPVVVMAVFNVVLFFRVILRKRRWTQLIEWGKYRKMAIQLLSISALYFFLHIPDMILTLAIFSGAHISFSDVFETYTKFFSTYTTFLLPFASAVSLPILKTKLKNLYPYRFQPKRLHSMTIEFNRGTDARQTNALLPMVN
ncbi:unnamed protein product [Rotaria magnacalcarata]|uniref:G-protein coupled receptors family 1 profile domain-containing protein n=1 Tax=Rotaria magnacalcarata TaxID=392030 RepID=A0A816X0G8_9BILA|nr:unnamed protein product [Rotaria magnacalcarata]